MTIDSFLNISVIGLRVLSIRGMEDLPKNKSILKEPTASQSELATREELKVTLSMVGSYTTTANMVAAANTLTTLLKGATTHTFEDTERGLSFAAVAKDGFRTNIYGHDYKMMQIDLPLTITTL
jgi:hypothetical protein